MADTVLLITGNRCIAQKVREACQDLDTSLAHVQTLKDAAEELATALPS